MDDDDRFRYTSMSIGSLGPSTLPKDAAKPFVIKNSLDTSDVDGAQSKWKSTKILNKPDHAANDDVDGARSKPLSRVRFNCGDNTLRVDDIDGAQAKIR